MLLGHNHLDRSGRIIRGFILTPVAARPYWIRDIPAFKFNPHARSDFRQEGKADLLAGIRHTGHAPAAFLAGQHGRNFRLDPHGRRIHLRDRAAVFAVETVAQTVQNIHDRLIVHKAPISAASPPVPPEGAGPTALRISTNFILWESAVMVWRTLQT